MMKLTRFVITFLIMVSLTTPTASAQRRGRGRGNSVDLIVRGATIVAMDGARRVIEDGAVAVRGGRILAVGTRAEIDGKYTARETIEARGKVVIPGLINGHTHVPRSEE